MTQQEQQMLDGLISRVQSTQLAGKDNDAEARIQNALGRNPDALYILCQTVLVQGYALEQAQRQLTEAREQLTQIRAQPAQDNHPGFLEKIFGSHADSSPTRPASGSQPNLAGSPAPGYGAPVYNAPGYAPSPSPVYAPPVYAQPGGMGGGMFGGGGGGFLQGAMQTAAGVAMGEIAVQSIEGLMHGFGHAAGYGSDRALGGFSDDSSRGFADSGSGGDSYGDRLQAADNPGSGLSSDIDDRRGDSSFGDGGSGDRAGFADAGTGDDLSDNSGYDNGGYDSSDDNSDGSDDSGSFDSGDSGSSDDNSF